MADALDSQGGDEGLDGEVVDRSWQVTEDLVDEGLDPGMDAAVMRGLDPRGEQPVHLDEAGDIANVDFDQERLCIVRKTLPDPTTVGIMGCDSLPQPR